MKSFLCLKYLNGVSSKCISSCYITYPSSAPSIDYLNDCSLGKKVDGQYMSDADDTEMAVHLTHGIRWYFYSVRLKLYEVGKVDDQNEAYRIFQLNDLDGINLFKVKKYTGEFYRIADDRPYKSAYVIGYAAIEVLHGSEVPRNDQDCSDRTDDD